jgi:membrane fusion protein, heavy metal efflux system
MAVRLVRGFRSLLGMMPTLVVLAALAGTAYWGHATDWKAPKFSAVLEGKSADKTDDRKAEPKKEGLDAKEAEGQTFAWCDQHGVPLDQCTICHPEIAVKGDAPPPAPAADAAKPDPRTCTTHLRTVEFASPETAQKAGIQLAPVREQELTRTVTAPGTIVYDQTRLAHLSSRVPGTVWRVEKRVGQPVRKGDVLVVVEAADVGRARGEFLQAVTQVRLKGQALERVKGAATALPERQLREAEAALTEARVRLFSAQQALLNLGLPVHLDELTGLSEQELARRTRFVGLPEGLVRTLDAESTSASLIPLTAPFDGMVLGRDVAVGEQVGPGQTTFEVADLSRMWVQLDVRLEDAAELRLGQEVTFRSDAAPDTLANGRITWVSTAADEKTRTVRARAEVDNRDGLFRANVFGTGRIRIAHRPRAVVVPSGAVQWEGCCHVVFVRAGDAKFQTRKVRPGLRGDGVTEVLVGVLPGEVVATTGSHVLKSELLKSRIAAGE